MVKQLLAICLFIILSITTFTCFAEASQPKFTILPNIKLQYLMAKDAKQAIAFKEQAIALVQQILHITADSPYRAIRIRFIFNNESQPQALIVYLLSNHYKSFAAIRINLTKTFTVASIMRNYRITTQDQMQSPSYAHPMVPKCPDDNVQFVIGNNFDGDHSVERNVKKVYRLAEQMGYHPFLMDTNNSDGPQPTVSAYENWLSCPNVKGFYNESHGSNEGILLFDGDFNYELIAKDLVDKLKHDVVLFDSCETFRDPLLNAIKDKQEGNVQQYIAGFINLPFGASERTASCFWLAAINQEKLTQALINTCSDQSGLERNAFRIAGNGSSYLSLPS